MHDYQMGVIESRFADLIWENEPISSTELARRSEAMFGWKKSTTYTVLKRLCDKGIFRNDKGTVTSVISRQEFYSVQSEKFVFQDQHSADPRKTKFVIKNKITLMNRSVLRLNGNSALQNANAE